VDKKIPPQMLTLWKRIAKVARELQGDGLVGVPKKVVLSTIALYVGVSNKSIF